MKITLRAGLLAAAGLGVVALVALMSWALSNKSPVTGMSGFTRVGQPVPVFTMSLFEGGEFDLAEHLGGPIVINFWASWCAPCREEAAGLERTWRAYQQAGVLLVGVDIQDADRDARAFIADFDASYPNGPDPDGKITVDYGVVGLPVTFFVGADGTVEGRWVGAIPEARLVAWVQALIAGERPSGETEGANPEGFRPLR